MIIITKLQGINISVCACICSNASVTGKLKHRQIHEKYPILDQEQHQIHILTIAV